MLQVGWLELVKALELVDRLEFLGCTARAVERTEHALCVVPVDAGGVSAVPQRERVEGVVGQIEGVVGQNKRDSKK